MIERDQRRALAACGDVRGAEIADDVEAEPRRRAGAVAELAGEALARPMQDRLAVQADQRDPGGIDRICREERAHRLDMRVGDRALELASGSLARSGSATTSRSACRTSSG